MKLKLMACTMKDAEFNPEIAKTLSGYYGAACYNQGSLNEIMSKEPKKALAIANSCVQRGHHSILDHFYLTFWIEGHSKMMAMILNSLGIYATSERSARYTKMEPQTEKEKFLYEKWDDIIRNEITSTYPNECSCGYIVPEKLAQENARYHLSIFTPTQMFYSASFRQFMYLIHWAEKFINEVKTDQFFANRIKGELNQFIAHLNNEFKLSALDDGKSRSMTFLAAQTNQKHLIHLTDKNNEYGNSYALVYDGSLAMLAQAHRHRTIRYNMVFIPNNTSLLNDGIQFYTPPIVKANEKLYIEWVEDMMSNSDNIPQGTMVKIIERGIIEDFILKSKERCCGRAQLETALITQKNGELLYNNILKKQMVDLSLELQDYFDDNYRMKARCATKSYNCTDHCIWGTDGLNRLI